MINGKIYIGQSVHIKTRFNQHKAEARNGNNRPLYNAIRKYGIENFSFEIIEECSQESLDEREIKRFPSVKAAALAMKCDTKNISRVCKKENGRITACGFKWEYDYSVYH